MTATSVRDHRTIRKERSMDWAIVTDASHPAEWNDALVDRGAGTRCAVHVFVMPNTRG